MERGPVDFHNHVIPGVDDGAVDEEQARAALEAFVAQGVRRLVATPHVDASLVARPAALAERLAELDAGWLRLRRVVEAAGGVEVLRGAEVMLDTPEPDLSDERLRLAGGDFALVEFPFMTVPPQSQRVLQRLVAAGVVPVIAHPERYAGVSPDSTLPEQWRSTGARLQVNAGSLTGRYGPQPQAIARALLERGAVDYVCSDYHARGRPATEAALQWFTDVGAGEQGDLLMVVNPTRLLGGEGPLPVPPVVVRRTLAERVRRLWGRA